MFRATCANTRSLFDVVGVGVFIVVVIDDEQLKAARTAMMQT